MAIDTILWFLISGIIIVALIIIGKLLDKWVTNVVNRLSNGLSAVEKQLDGIIRQIIEFTVRQDEINKHLTSELQKLELELQKVNSITIKLEKMHNIDNHPH